MIGEFSEDPCSGWVVTHLLLLLLLCRCTNLRLLRLLEGGVGIVHLLLLLLLLLLGHDRCCSPRHRMPFDSMK
jgi:hypothetical protein